MLRLSPSQISTYRRCSLQWWFAYVARIKMKPVGKMTQGRAVHRGIEVGLTEKLEHGALPPVSVVTDAIAESFDYEAKLTTFEDDEKPDQLKDQAVGLGRLHHAQVAPGIEPLFLEHMMTADVDGIGILMVADVIEQDATVRDHKTSGRRVDGESLRVDPALASYTLGYEQTMGTPIRAVRLDRLITTKTPDVQSEEIPREQVDTQRFRAVAKGVAEGIQRRVFLPADDMRVCGWCGYRPICWGARWAEYLKNPDLARDAAGRVLAGKLMPPQAATQMTLETPS